MIAGAVTGCNDPVLATVSSVSGVVLLQLDLGAVVSGGNPLPRFVVVNEFCGRTSERHDDVVACPAQVALLPVLGVVVVRFAVAVTEIVGAGTEATLDVAGVVVPSVTHPGRLAVGRGRLAVHGLRRVGESDGWCGTGRSRRDRQRVGPRKPAATAPGTPGTRSRQRRGLVRATRAGSAVGGCEDHRSASGARHRPHALDGGCAGVDRCGDRLGRRVVGAGDVRGRRTQRVRGSLQETRRQLPELQAGRPLGTVEVAELRVVQLHVHRCRGVGRRRNGDDGAVDLRGFGLRTLCDGGRPGPRRGGSGPVRLADADRECADSDGSRGVGGQGLGGDGPDRCSLLRRLVVSGRLYDLAVPALELRGSHLVELGLVLFLERRQLDTGAVARWCRPGRGGQKSCGQDHGQCDAGAPGKARASRAGPSVSGQAEIVRRERRHVDPPTSCRHGMGTWTTGN